MPLFKRKLWKLQPPPPDLRDDEKLWVVRFTNEVFRDYDEYLARLDLYRQRIWQCQYSGRAGLTFEEALVCEAATAAKTKSFPEPLVKSLLEFVHYSHASLNELVDQLHEHFQTLYMPGEIVEVLEAPSSNSKDSKTAYTARIVRTVEDTNVSASSTNEPARHNEVTPLNGTAASRVVPTTYLRRPRNLLTKELLRHKVRAVATRDLSKNAPWLVHDHLLAAYNLAPGEAARRRKRSREEEMQEDEGEEAMEAEEEGGDDIDGAIANGSESLGRPAKRQRVGPGEPLAADLSRHPPTPSADFGVPESMVDSLVVSFVFLHSFARGLRLSPFTMADLAAALAHNARSPLLNEVFVRLLRTLPHDGAVVYDAWDTALRLYLQRMDRREEGGLRGRLKRMFPALELSEELVEMAFGRRTRAAEDTDKEVESSDEDSRRTRKRRKKKGTDMKGGKQNRDEEESSGDSDSSRSSSSSSSGSNSSSSSSDEDSTSEEEVVPPTAISQNGLGTAKQLQLLGELKRRGFVKLPLEHKVALLRLLVDDAASTEAVRSQLEESRESTAELNKELRERDAAQKKLAEEHEGEDRLKWLKEQQRKREDERERAAEKYRLRFVPMGEDRHRNRYWYFGAAAPAQLFVERPPPVTAAPPTIPPVAPPTVTATPAPEEGEAAPKLPRTPVMPPQEPSRWGYYSTPRELEELEEFLDPTISREYALRAALQKKMGKLVDAMRKKAFEMQLALMGDQTRRSTRLQTQREKEQVKVTKKPPFMTYVNRYAQRPQS